MVNSTFFVWTRDVLPPLVCNLTFRMPPPLMGAVNTTTMAVDVTGVDESIVSSTYAVDGASSWSRARASESGLLVEVDVVGDGVHTMLVKARDAAGNESPRPCTNLTWRVDTTPPMLSVISPAPGFRTPHDWVTVGLQGNEPLSAVLIWLPGAAAWLRSTALTVVLNTTGAGPKYALFRGGTTHVLASIVSELHCLSSFSFLAVDLVGNTQLVATNVSWVVDQTAPWFWPILLPPGLNNFTTFNVSFAWSEALAGLWWSTDGSAFQPLAVAVGERAFTLPVNATLDGNHTLALKGASICCHLCCVSPTHCLLLQGRTLLGTWW